MIYKVFWHNKNDDIGGQLLDGVSVHDEVDDTEQEIDEGVDIVSHTLDHEEGPTVLGWIFLLFLVLQEKFPCDWPTAVRALIFSHHF